MTTKKSSGNIIERRGIDVSSGESGETIGSSRVGCRNRDELKSQKKRGGNDFIRIKRCDNNDRKKDEKTHLELQLGAAPVTSLGVVLHLESKLSYRQETVITKGHVNRAKPYAHSISPNGDNDRPNLVGISCLIG